MPRAGWVLVAVLILALIGLNVAPELVAVDQQKTVDRLAREVDELRPENERLQRDLALTHRQATEDRTVLVTRLEESIAAQNALRAQVEALGMTPAAPPPAPIPSLGTTPSPPAVPVPDLPELPLPTGPPGGLCDLMPDILC